MLKSNSKIKPIRYWKIKQIKSQIYLNFLALCLEKKVENAWKKRRTIEYVRSTLQEWDYVFRLNDLLDMNNRQSIELQWSQGQNAQLIREQIEKFGEARHILCHL